MWSIHKRIAQLHRIDRARGLTDEEKTELRLCLDANMNKAEKIVTLENYSFMAYATEDYEWLNDVVRQIDELQEEMVYR